MRFGCKISENMRYQIYYGNREQARSHNGSAACLDPAPTATPSVGAELARDSGGSGCIEVECAAVTASKLGSQTDLGCSWNRCSPQFSVGAGLLAIAVCLRRCCWMYRPIREQARSHTRSKPITNPHARQNPVSRHPLPCIKVTPPAPALSERLGPPFPGTVTDGTS